MLEHSSRERALAWMVGALWLVPGVGGSHAQESTVEMSDLTPGHHYRLRDAAELGTEQAQSFYAVAVRALEFGYARADVDAARTYRQWQKFNVAPYLSATHGRHMVNNYANTIAAARYGTQTHEQPMPIGALVAKDSFAVTGTGSILLGPLFVMEKMQAGFDPQFGDWKYSMVMPDGTIVGQTGGAGSERVEYCVSCHFAVHEQDYLYNVPESAR